MGADTRNQEKYSNLTLDSAHHVEDTNDKLLSGRKKISLSDPSEELLNSDRWAADAATYTFNVEVEWPSLKDAAKNLKCIPLNSVMEQHCN